MKIGTVIKAGYSLFYLIYKKIQYGNRINFKASKSILSSSTRILINGNSEITFAGKICTERNVDIKAENGGKIYIDKSVFINSNSMITCLDCIYIGARTLIGPSVLIFDHDHDFEKDFELGVSEERHFITKPIRIEEDSWIGANVVILKGVSIGKGAVVAAGSVVTKDVEPYSVYAGCPARKIRSLDKSKYKR